VSNIGLAGAAAALGDETHMTQAVALAVRERQRVAAALTVLGSRCAPSAGNFLLVHAGPKARERFDALLRLGIIVRPVAGYGLPEYLRVSLGTVAENDRFLAAWRTLLA